MKPIAVLDLETEPFKHGRTPRPFAAGYYDGSKFWSIWDEENCIARTYEALEREPASIIHAHNGGRFDWFYFLDRILLPSKIAIIGGRIVKARLGKHEIRDSWAIFPLPLAEYRKTSIDIRKMSAGRRRQHRAEILAYLESDCKNLYDLCVAFYTEFGNVSTIGGAALRQLRSYHQITSGRSEFDEKFRGRFYYGGRVQVFGPAVVEESVSMVDVNSMYPAVMKNYRHPVSTGTMRRTRVEPDTCFLTVQGESDGAFPVRTMGEHGPELAFPRGYGTFHVTIHEFNAALELGCFKPKRIIETFSFDRRISFGKFVDNFYWARRRAIRAKDRIHDLFYKLLMNSAGGKLAQNPEGYSEYQITGLCDMPKPWAIAATCFDDRGGKHFLLWRRPAAFPIWYNVATAASITGAARAELLRGLHAVTRPYYCDTDSIIAHSVSGLKIDPISLGGWKIEARGSRAVFAGKKIYAIFDAQGNTVKKAHKGFSATGAQIEKIARGGRFDYRADAPTFRIGGGVEFSDRTIRSTYNA